MSEEEAQEAARKVAIQLIATIKSESSPSLWVFIQPQPWTSRRSYTRHGPWTLRLGPMGFMRCFVVSSGYSYAERLQSDFCCNSDDVDFIIYLFPCCRCGSAVNRLARVSIFPLRRIFPCYNTNLERARVERDCEQFPSRPQLATRRKAT